MQHICSKKSRTCWSCTPVQCDANLIYGHPVFSGRPGRPCGNLLYHYVVASSDEHEQDSAKGSRGMSLGKSTALSHFVALCIIWHNHHHHGQRFFVIVLCNGVERQCGKTASTIVTATWDPHGYFTLKTSNSLNQMHHRWHSLDRSPFI